MAADSARVTPTEPRVQEPRAAVTSRTRPGTEVTWRAHLVMRVSDEMSVAGEIRSEYSQCPRFNVPFTAQASCVACW